MTDNNERNKPLFNVDILYWNIEFDFEHPFRISKGGYVHIPLLSLSFGSNGFAFYLLAFSIAVSWHKKKPRGYTIK